MTRRTSFVHIYGEVALRDGNLAATEVIHACILSPLVLILTCFLALFLICYARPYSFDRQLGYRDAGALLLSAQPAGSGGVEPGTMAAVGA